MDNKLETKVVTGKARLSYAHIWQPHAIEEGSEPKYSCSLIIPKSDKKTIAAVNQAIENAKKAGAAKWGGKVPANLKLPLRDGDADRPDDENYKNCYFINANSSARPGVVDRNKQTIIDPEEVYSGCYVMASINFYAFNVSGNRGVAAGLNNLMKVSEGEPLGGKLSAERDFADVEVDDEEDAMLA